MYLFFTQWYLLHKVLSLSTRTRIDNGVHSILKEGVQLAVITTCVVEGSPGSVSIHSDSISK